MDDKSVLEVAFEWICECLKNNAKSTQQMSRHGTICLKFSHAKVVIVSKI